MTAKKRASKELLVQTKTKPLCFGRECFWWRLANARTHSLERMKCGFPGKMDAKHFVNRKGNEFHGFPRLKPHLLLWWANLR
jgi:hypothetical protein